MFAAAARFELRLPSCHSLKDKRTVLKPVVEGARRRFAVAAAEVGEQDKWQRAQVAMSTVGASEGHVCDILDAVERFVWSFPEIEVLDSSRHWLEVDA